jgi:tetratricopeptide (TPR) repeat protein
MNNVFPSEYASIAGRCMPPSLAAPREIAELFKGEIFEEAEALCLEDLGRSRKSALVVHICGLLAQKRGAAAASLALLHRAASLAPKNVRYVCDLGEAFLRAGRTRDAVAAYLRVATLSTDEPQLYRALGYALLRDRQILAARALLELAVGLDTDHAPTYLDLADALLALGHRVEALAAYCRSLELASSPNGHMRLGQAYLSAGEWRAAADSFRKGLSFEKNHPGLNFGLGQALQRGGDLDGAEEAYRAAICSGEAKACVPLVCVLELMGRRAETVGVWCWYGSSLSETNRHGEAAVAYRQALAAKPDCLRALTSSGSAYIRLRQPDKAKAAYAAALTLQPEHRWAHIGLGQALHASGDLSGGWQELAWYNREKNIDRFEQPMWSGEPLHGQRILLWADWYLGDTIQLIRYVRHVKALGGSIIVHCEAVLARLIERMEAVDRVVPVKHPLPAFDVHAPLGELPRILGTKLKTIPVETPYLTPDTTSQKHWRDALGPVGERRVGLVWSGDPTRNNASLRFTSLSVFAPLAGTPHTRFFSLQLGPPASELLAPPAGLEVEAPLSQSATMDNTAGLMMNLDLIISVDTMAAHLAGALGRPVWLLTPFAPDWRWHAQAGRSPWYPTMRVFTQQRQGDWMGVTERVRQALGESIEVGPLSMAHRE